MSKVKYFYHKMILPQVNEVINLKKTVPNAEDIDISRSGI